MTTTYVDFIQAFECGGEGEFFPLGDDGTLDLVSDLYPTPAAGNIAITAPTPTITGYKTVVVVRPQPANLNLSGKEVVIDGYNKYITPRLSNIVFSGPTASLWQAEAPIITTGSAVVMPVTTIAFSSNVTAGGELAPTIIIKPKLPKLLFLGAAPTWFYGRVLDVTAPTVAIAGGSTIHAGNSIIVTPQAGTISFECGADISVTNNPSNFEMTLPSLFMSSMGPESLEITLPTLSMEGQMRSSKVAVLEGTLPNLQILLRTGGVFEGSLPNITAEFAGYTDYISDLEVMMPSLSLLMHSTHGGPNDISGVLPSIRLAIKAFTGEVASLDVLLPALQIECGAVAGIVADLEAMLPAFKIRMEGMRTGENSLDLELKRLELIMSEVGCLSTILRHVRGEIR